MSILQIILMIFQIFLAFCNACIMVFAFKMFLSKPRESLEAKVAELIVKVKEIEDSLNLGNDRFRAQEKTNEVLISSTLALIEFEIQYCLTEDKLPTPELQKSKENLQSHLAKMGGFGCSL